MHNSTQCIMWSVTLSTFAYVVFVMFVNMPNSFSQPLKDYTFFPSIHGSCIFDERANKLHCISGPQGQCRIYESMACDTRGGELPGRRTLQKMCCGRRTALGPKSIEDFRFTIANEILAATVHSIFCKATAKTPHKLLCLREQPDKV